MRTAALCIFSLAATSASAQIPPNLSVLCPKPKPGEIVVCADEEPPPKSPYRLPLPVPLVEGSRETISPSRERNALLDYDIGGTGSCSTVGAGGWTGCKYREHMQNAEQRAMSKDGRGHLFEQQPK
jgi:hypothetical protein